MVQEAHSAYLCVLAVLAQPPRRSCTSLRVLQSVQDSRIASNHASNGSGNHGSRLDACGTDYTMSPHEKAAREFNKTSKFAHTCKACGRVFLLEEVTWHDSKWEDRNGEERLIEVRNKCPHCSEIRAYAANELELRQPDESGKIPSESQYPH